MAPPGLAFIAFYLALFLVLGLYLPFWPVFLADRGLDGPAIGLLLALSTWAKVAGNPLIGRLSDRSLRPGRVLVGLAATAFAAAWLFHVVAGFWGLLAVNLVVFSAFQALIPLGDSRLLAAGRVAGTDYGRVRLWGSAAFLVAVLALGEGLDALGPALVPWSLCAGLGLLLGAALALPAPPDSAPPAPLRQRPVQPGILAVLRARRFVLFLAVGTLLQASHAVYYAFSAVAWQAAGLSATTIGWLWAEGVVAEILLFWWGARVLARLGPTGLLLLAAAGGLLRWGGLAATAEPAALAALQVLHAATFGAAHLGAMHFISRETPTGNHGTAHGLYAAATGGLGMGLALLAAGPLYDAAGLGAYHAMQAMSLAAGLLVIPLLRARNLINARKLEN